MHHNLPIVARSIHPIEWIERANFFIFKFQQCLQYSKKWRSYEKKTPLFSPFLLFSRQKFHFSLCLSIVIGCAYVVRTNPRTQSLLSINPVGVATMVQWVEGTYRRGDYRGAVCRGYAPEGWLPWCSG